MVLETVRIIADWLGHATHGVNALRASVPRDTGVDTAPAVTILDSTRDPRVARGGVPQELTAAERPAVLVSPNDSPIDQTAPAVAPFPPDAVVPVLVRVALSKIDTAAAERDASQILRAVWRSMGALMKTSAGEAARSRASVQITQIASLQAATLYESTEDTIVTAGVLVTCRVRDLWAIA